MKISVFRNRLPESDPAELLGNQEPPPQHLECAYAGCRNGVSLKKASSVVVNFMGQRMQLEFAGLSDPYFEQPPLSFTDGADLPGNALLNIQWKRLDFFAQHSLVGPIELSIRRDKASSLGRVVPLVHPDLNKFKPLLQTDSYGASEDKLFPAYNENHLYFMISFPQMGLQFISEEPIVNAAIIEQIPPLQAEYSFKQPVKFRSINTPVPQELTIEECRIGMTTLSGIYIKVKDFKKTSEVTSTLTVEVVNESDQDNVTVALLAESACNIQCKPDRYFFDLDRNPVDIELEIDITPATPPGSLTIELILIRPYESRGSNNILIDYRELEAGKFIDGIPE